MIYNETLAKIGKLHMERMESQNQQQHNKNVYSPKIFRSSTNELKKMWSCGLAVKASFS